MLVYILLRQGLKRTVRLDLSYLLFCILPPLLQLSVQFKNKSLPTLQELLPLKMFKAHCNSNYIVDDLKMGHPTGLIKTLMQSSSGGNKDSL